MPSLNKTPLPCSSLAGQLKLKPPIDGQSVSSQFSANLFKASEIGGRKGIMKRSPQVSGLPIITNFFFLAILLLLLPGIAHFNPRCYSLTTRLLDFVKIENAHHSTSYVHDNFYS